MQTIPLYVLLIQYIRYLVNLANEKLEENLTRTDRLVFFNTYLSLSFTRFNSLITLLGPPRKFKLHHSDLDTRVSFVVLLSVNSLLFPIFPFFISLPSHLFPFHPINVFFIFPLYLISFASDLFPGLPLSQQAFLSLFLDFSQTFNTY